MMEVYSDLLHVNHKQEIPQVDRCLNWVHEKGAHNDPKILDQRQVFPCFLLPKEAVATSVELTESIGRSGGRCVEVCRRWNTRRNPNYARIWYTTGLVQGPGLGTLLFARASSDASRAPTSFR